MRSEPTGLSSAHSQWYLRWNLGGKKKKFLLNDVSIALKKKKSPQLLKNTVDVNHMPEWRSSR